MSEPRSLREKVSRYIKYTCMECDSDVDFQWNYYGDEEPDSMLQQCPVCKTVVVVKKGERKAYKDLDAIPNDPDVFAAGVNTDG